MTHLMLIIVTLLSILWMLGWGSVIIGNATRAFSQKDESERHDYLKTVLISWCLMGLLPVLIVVFIVQCLS